MTLILTIMVVPADAGMNIDVIPSLPSDTFGSWVTNWPNGKNRENGFIVNGEKTGVTFQINGGEGKSLFFLSMLTELVIAAGYHDIGEEIYFHKTPIKVKIEKAQKEGFLTLRLEGTTFSGKQPLVVTFTGPRQRIIDIRAFLLTQPVIGKHYKADKSRRCCMVVK